MWVNTKRVCDHEGGYTPFDCEVTSVLKPGANFVVIAVDATRRADGIPSTGIDWFNYGGLTRDVSLVTVPQEFIDDYDVHLVHGAKFEAGNTDLEGYVHVLGAAPGSSISIEVPEAGARTTATTDVDGKASFRVKAAKLTLWSPATPKLYKVTLASGADRLTDDIGFRDIRVDGTRILLNGQAVFLQGANMHAEAPVRGGRVDSDADVSTIFRYLKELNANFVRLAHYPHDERMEREADRDGIMVWSEIPNWQHIQFDNPEVYARDVVMLKEMIRRDRNKASVILWSVSNETPNNPVRTKFLTDLANEARALDPTRLITSAIIGPRAKGFDYVNERPAVRSARCRWDRTSTSGGTREMPRMRIRSIGRCRRSRSSCRSSGPRPSRGITVRSTSAGPRRQEAYVLQQQFVLLAKIPQLRGVTPWILVDFRSPTRNIPKLQDGYNRKGLIAEDGKKKLAFDTVRKAYAAHSIGKPE